jgi:hypothetical protein
VKSAEESGRGIWELTEKGKNYYDELVKYLDEFKDSYKKKEKHITRRSCVGRVSFFNATELLR